MSYLDMTGIIEEEEKITIRQAWERLSGKGKFKLLTQGMGDNKLFELCAKSERFGNVIISDYVDNTEVRENKQFAAMTFHINQTDAFIVFRGTDDTIVGWKEDFMLSYCRVPAQGQALEYARDMVAKNRNCYIGGHSKGANLALYASAHLEEEKILKVRKIFLNDGPGFCPDVLDTGLIKKIDNKCVRITPEYCIVGAIFEPAITESYIVKSSASQMLQHSMLSWQVKVDSLETTDLHDAVSEEINGLFDKFIEKMDSLPERQAFVNSIFDTMGEHGAVTIADFMKEGPGAFENLIITVLGETDDGYNPLKRVKDNITSDFKRSSMGRFLSSKNEKKTLLRIVTSFLIAILCFLIPENFIKVTFAIAYFLIVVYQLSITFHHLKKSKWDFYRERLRVNISIVLIVSYTILILKDDALFLFSSILFGIFFLMSAYQCVLKYNSSKGNKHDRWRYAFEAIYSVVFGSYLLFSPQVAMTWYTMVLGSFIFIDGAFEAVSFYKKIKKYKTFVQKNDQTAR